jgi:hypothetical protein
VIYDELVQRQAGGGPAARRAQAASAPRPVAGPLPWLLYAGGDDYLARTDVDLT